MKGSSDEGSTLPLTIFFGVLSLALILVVAAATSLYLERKRLFTLADGAALMGAEAFRLEDVTAANGGYRAALRSADVAAAAETYLAGIPTTEFTHLSLDDARSIDGASASVTLSADWVPPVLGAILPEGVRVEVTATARSVFG